MHDPEFKINLLYEQKRQGESGEYIHTFVNSASYIYPEALHPTVARLKFTVIYESANTRFLPLIGLIEKWSSDGWVFIDEVYPTSDKCNSIDKFLERIYEITKSFLTGIALETSQDIEEEEEEHIEQPNLRVIKFKNNEE